MIRELISLLKYPSENHLREALLMMVPTFNQDKFGNLYIINPGAPLLCAHMDTVADEDDIKKLSKIKHKKGIIQGQGVIGGDDRVGVYIALKIYEQLGNKVSILLTSREESGGIGSAGFDKELLNETPYCVVIDRKGNSDIIGYLNNYCTQEFEDKVHEYLKPFGYLPTHGVWSDADKLKFNLNCVNLSCGYYNQHTDKESIIVADVEKAIKAITVLVSEYKEKLDPPEPEFDYDGYRNYLSYPGHIFGYGYEDEEDEEDTWEYEPSDWPIEPYGETDVVVHQTCRLINYETGMEIWLPKGDYMINTYSRKRKSKLYNYPYE